MVIKISAHFPYLSFSRDHPSSLPGYCLMAQAPGKCSKASEVKFYQFMWCCDDLALLELEFARFSLFIVITVFL